MEGLNWTRIVLTQTLIYFDYAIPNPAVGNVNKYIYKTKVFMSIKNHSILSSLEEDNTPFFFFFFQDYSL